jgi:glycosyltransferase involved in cell wall biosynthesis
VTRPEAEATAATPRVSVVIPTHNGGATLAGTLTALAEQTLPAADYEVIVVDDGSTDDTAAIAEAGGARLVRLVPNHGVAVARNRGIDAARAPVLAFTDDDCLPAPDWLEQVLAAFEDPAVDGIGGRVVPSDDRALVLRYLAVKNPLTPLFAELLVSHALLYRLRLYLRGLSGPSPEAGPGAELFAVVGANMALRAELLESIGGFDDNYHFGGEEEELCRRAHQRPGGTRLVYWPSALVRHVFRPELRDTLRRARAYGVGNARSAAKHDDVRLIVYPFPVAVALLLAAGLGLRRAPLVAAALAAPAALYYGWPLRALRERRAEPLGYAYIQLAQEVATMAGEVRGLRERRG